MLGAKHVASFIGHDPGKALFVGLYEIGDSWPMTYEQYWKVPAHIEMKTFGMKGFTAEDPRKSLLWFDLGLTDFYTDWKGKLVIGWPGKELSWWRRAHSNIMPVLAVHEESRFDTAMPSWKYPANRGLTQDPVKFTQDVSYIRYMNRRIRCGAPELLKLYADRLPIL